MTTEPGTIIPAGTRGTHCPMCGRIVWLVPRPSNCAMAVELTDDPERSWAPSDPEHTGTRWDGRGAAHLPVCPGDPRRSRDLSTAHARTATAMEGR